MPYFPIIFYLCQLENMQTMNREDTTVTTLHEWGEDVFPKLSWFKRQKVEQARVMVVGCGALGNEVLKNLALFGVGLLVVVDFDRVEYSNLTRSVLFSHEDARQACPKVQAVARRIHDINPQIKVLPLEADITWQVGLGLIRRMDVVVGCLDNRWARYALNRLCMRAGVPWVDGGMEGLEGIAKVFVPGKNCYACTLEPGAWKELSRNMSCASAIRRNEQAERIPTTPVVASVIGAVQAQEVMKLIHREEVERGELTSLCGKMFYYEGQHLTSRLIAHQGWDEDCPVHECWTPIVPTGMTINHRINEMLDVLASQFQTDEVEIMLRNHRWVDYIEEKESGHRTEAMLPDREINRFIEEHPVLRHVPTGAFYQHEYRCIDKEFPYPYLTLQELGIPDSDVLHIRTHKGDFFMELSPWKMDLKPLMT